MNADLVSLESFLSEVKNHLPQDRETAIFELGGRGHYENPTTDLLAFFLNPDADHGLRDLFLSAFLECIGEGNSQLDMSCVKIWREEPTANQNRIDLLILGQDWCLIIENKIYHGPSNPFRDYEAHAEKLGKEKKLFSILAPKKILPPTGSATPDLWKPVAYKEYLQKLQDRMATKFFDVPFSKWHVFAREFILHIKNELYNPPMKPEDAEFVENHAAELIQARILLQHYPGYLRSVVKEKIEKEFGYAVDDVDVNLQWAIQITSPKKWRKITSIWLCYQGNDESGPTGIPNGKFAVWLWSDDSNLKPDAMEYKGKEKRWETGKDKNLVEAVDCIIHLVKLIEVQPA